LIYNTTADSVRNEDLKPRPRILVCIPAYNEATSIGDIIKKAATYASEIIVYDDGSNDNTAEVAKAAGATVIRDPKNKGYGIAISMLLATAKKRNTEVMVTLDSDGQHNPDEIPRVVEPLLNEGIDIVIGSRFLGDKNKESKVPVYRNLGIRAITRFTQSASYNQLTDAQSGFRGYGKNALSKINVFEEGMAVSTEILLRAKEKNLLMKEVPITVHYDVKEPSTHNPASHGTKVLSSVIQFISFRHPLAFYGLPGIAFLIIAIVLLDYAVMVYGSYRHSSVEYLVSSVGFGVVAVVLLATGVIIYTITALLKGRIKDL
jgi:glycosyltransferase involved in cell wall biosynthesis